MTNSRPKLQLRAETVSIQSLSRHDQKRMFELMEKYYENVDWDQFVKDLSKKDQVILLKDSIKGNQIQGFSTVLHVSLSQNQGRGIFSGDTVVDREYWGQRTLGHAFLKHLWLQKMKHPFRPLYWFLMSKGYKTYLMMANNFSEYYPRFDRPTPVGFRKIMDEFYSQLYPNHYESQFGLIRFNGPASRLKVDVVPISETLLQAHPKVAFFESANPDWKIGTELCCIAKMTLWMPVFYRLKAIFKGTFK